MKTISFFKAGLFFGLIMSVCFIIQNLMMNENSTGMDITKSVLAGFAGGAVSGILYAVLLRLISRSRYFKLQVRFEMLPDESILFESGANHFVGAEAVGGKLFLTNQRLVFKSHSWNFQNHQFVIRSSDLQGYNRFKPLGVANNGLEMLLAAGTSEKFVVEDLERWVKHLDELILSGKRPA